MKLRAVGTNAAIILASTIVGLLIGEVVLRMALRASDYLSVDMVVDPVLGRVPSTQTRSAGFDAWGFRNRAVPARADVVALGDSHTYGNTARMEDAWPAVLSRASGQVVYNMGLGGYGPNQYLHLLRTRALELKPRTVVVGLYMGDDFENAFLITYGLDHWAYLREIPANKVNFDIWESPPALTWHKKIRNWLSKNSVLYQLVVHGPGLGRLRGEATIARAHRDNPQATSLVLPDKNIQEAFLPTGILRRLDQSHESVREGMRITFKLLAEMNDISRKAGARFVVAVIPSKEMVFAEHFEANPTIPLSDVIAKLLPNEREAREKTFAALSQAGIEYVDTLPMLRKFASQQLYARTAGDMHPGANGYRVIGETINEFIARTK